jgi:phospholipid-translocating ATPase
VLTPVNPWTTWVPLIVIFAVSATKEAIDDQQRARADTVANQRQYTVYRDGRQGLVQAQHIGVGDVVVVLENEEMPCDLVLLASTNRSGQAFIQTTNLDGTCSLSSAGRSLVDVLLTL